MEEQKVPAGTVMTVIVPLDRSQTKKATFYLSEMKEDIFLASKALQDQGKHGDAVRMIVKMLSLPGSDSADLLKDNFVALNSASKPIIELITPIEAEVKKNW